MRRPTDPEVPRRRRRHRPWMEGTTRVNRAGGLPSPTGTAGPRSPPAPCPAGPRQNDQSSGSSRTPSPQGRHAIRPQLQRHSTSCGRQWLTSRSRLVLRRGREARERRAGQPGEEQSAKLLRDGGATGCGETAAGFVHLGLDLDENGRLVLIGRSVRWCHLTGDATVPHLVRGGSTKHTSVISNSVPAQRHKRNLAFCPRNRPARSDRSEMSVICPASFVPSDLVKGRTIHYPTLRVEWPKSPCSQAVSGRTRYVQIVRALRADQIGSREHMAPTLSRGLATEKSSPYVGGPAHFRRASAAAFTSTRASSTARAISSTSSRARATMWRATVPWGTRGGPASNPARRSRL